MGQCGRLCSSAKTSDGGGQSWERRPACIAQVPKSELAVASQRVQWGVWGPCYEAEKMLGPGRKEYLRATFKNQRSTKPNMIIYAEDGMEFIRAHCGDKSAQNVTLVIDKVPSIKDISFNSILLPSFTIA